MPDPTITPQDCPTPIYHETHYYCPSCSFVAEDAPVSEAEAQRGRADALHAELGEALAERKALLNVVRAARETVDAEPGDPRLHALRRLRAALGTLPQNLED